MMARPRLEAMPLKVVCVAEPLGTYMILVVSNFFVQIPDAEAVMELPICKVKSFNSVHPIKQ